MQQRLFRFAHVAGSFSFYFVPLEGWSLTVSLRRGDEPWASAYRETYSHLSTEELVSVLEATCHSELLPS